MAKIISIHPKTPQTRVVEQIVGILNQDKGVIGKADTDIQGIIAYPTSSGYALGCKITNQKAAEKIRLIRNLQEKQDFTLMCADISQASSYAKIDDKRFKFIKNLKTEDFTFLLPVAPLLPKKTGSKRGTVGIRIASNPALKDVLELLNEPILSTSLLIPNEEGISKGYQVHQGFSKGLNLQAFSSAWQIEDAIGNLIDAIVEFDNNDYEEIEINTEPTTVLDLTDIDYEVVRQGKGIVE